jgi:hypothetical protein
MSEKIKDPALRQLIEFSRDIRVRPWGILREGNESEWQKLRDRIQSYPDEIHETFIALQEIERLKDEGFQELQEKHLD